MLHNSEIRIESHGCPRVFLPLRILCTCLYCMLMTVKPMHLCMSFATANQGRIYYFHMTETFLSSAHLPVTAFGHPVSMAPSINFYANPLGRPFWGSKIFLHECNKANSPKLMSLHPDAFWNFKRRINKLSMFQMVAETTQILLV